MMYYIKTKQGWYISKGGTPPRIQLLTSRNGAFEFTKEKALEVIRVLNRDPAIAEQLQMFIIEIDESITNK